MIDYFDSSALAAILLDEPTRTRVNAHLRALADPPQISDLVVAEVSSAISRLLRMKLRTPTQAATLIEALDEWVRETGEPIALHASDMREATLLVRRFDLKLRPPEAIHLAICRRLEARLVTLDNALAQAAISVEVACINPADSSAT